MLEFLDAVLGTGVSYYKSAITYDTAYILPLLIVSGVFYIAMIWLDLRREGHAFVPSVILSLLLSPFDVAAATLLLGPHLVAGTYIGDFAPIVAAFGVFVVTTVFLYGIHRWILYPVLRS